MAESYKLREGSLQERFNNLRTKLQIYGGGYGNGKTSAAVVLKCLVVARDYPGANILVARESYPKLNDTIRKEFFKWCPPTWIAKRPTKDDNTCILKNGTHINFRYIEQQGKNTSEGGTSNLLSANYDLIIIDQLEDPGITHKDFMDLFGRLRGSARYIGDDPTMPKTGPRWMVVTLNPNRNWTYKQIIKPYHVYLDTGIILPELLIDEKTKEPIIGLVEDSTYENKENLPEDFIDGLKAVYHGSMRDRFLNGLWAGYEGLVYPEYDIVHHQIQHEAMVDYLTMLTYLYGKVPTVIEGYDYGLSVPSCYIFAMVDHFGNVFCLDGFYQPGLQIQEQESKIKAIREKYCTSRIKVDKPIYADPSIFRRGPGSRDLVGKTVADLFWNYGNGILMQRANNNIISGITKVSSYLQLIDDHRNPITNVKPAPHLYFSDRLTFVDDEIGDYYWQKDSDGEPIDKPNEGKDHAMDTLKYLLTSTPELARPIEQYKADPMLVIKRWQEVETQNNTRRARYGH